MSSKNSFLKEKHIFIWWHIIMTSDDLRIKLIASSLNLVSNITYK